MLVCKKDTKPLSREKGDANMTYFAFHVSKIENFETLVLILKISLEIDDVIIKCLALHISKTVNFQVMVLRKNLFRIKLSFE